MEPRYDHPKFQTAFKELNELLVHEFDNNPLIEFVDLMMYGFWGEGHTSNLPNPFSDYVTAAKTTLEMTKIQLDLWKRVPLAVNTQPDSSTVGNREVQDLCVRSGCWLLSGPPHNRPIQTVPSTFSYCNAMIQNGERVFDRIS